MTATTRSVGSTRHSKSLMPTHDLVTTLQVLHQSERLKVAERLPEAAVLVQELLNFRVRTSAAAHDIYEAWREGEHDELVLAVALASWYGERPPAEPRITLSVGVNLAG